jgi:tRNA (mo5U34)-methyltransferase
MPNNPSRARRIAELQPWFHNLHLPDGSQTAPEHSLGDFPAYKWAEIAPFLPVDMDGWSALDIGCNAGFYSIELARRGARVTAIDLNAHYLKQARWAAGEFGLADRITFRRMQIYELARSSAKYDLVLFLGVFYHLRYPLLGLDIAMRKTGRQLIFQTLTMPGEEALTVPEDLPFAARQQLCHPGWPKMAFIEHRLADDPTNWWAPNDAAVQAMLRSSGLKILALPGEEIYLCEPDLEHPSCTTTWDREEYEAASGVRRRRQAGAVSLRPGPSPPPVGSHAFSAAGRTEVL